MARRFISSGSSFEETIGYSRAVVDGDWLFMSGTTGFDYRTMTLPEDVVAQAEQCLRNIRAAVEEAGFSMLDIVRVQYILTDPDEFPKLWDLVKRELGPARAASTMIAARLADPRMKIEIEVTAKRRS